MAADLRNADRTRSRWLLPVAATAVVLAVAGGTVAVSRVLSHGHNKPTASQAAPAGSATREVVLRPVTASGEVVPGFEVHDDAAVSCSLASYVAVDNGIAWCSPAYLAAVACWPSTESAYVFCLQDAWSHEIVRHPLAGAFPSSTARADPAPIGIELSDGSRCLIRSSGTGEDLVGHPGWTYTYFCPDGQALWAPGFATTVDKSAAVWTAQQAPTEGTTPPHTVEVAAVYLAGTAPD